jgi:hypothetical protein
VSGLAVLLEFPGGLHDALGALAFAGVGDDAGIIEGHLLAVEASSWGL